MSGKTGVKRKARTTEFKYQAILEVERGGKSQTKVAKDLGVSTSTLASWLANKDSIRQRHDGHEPEAKRPRKPRYTLDFIDPKPRVAVAEARPSVDDVSQESEAKKASKRRPQYTLDFADPKPRATRAGPSEDDVIQDPKPEQRRQQGERAITDYFPKSDATPGAVEEDGEAATSGTDQRAAPRKVTVDEALRAVDMLWRFFEAQPDCTEPMFMLCHIYTSLHQIKLKEKKRSLLRKIKKKST